MDRRLSIGERKSLIDYHARCIVQEFGGVQLPDRESVVEHIKRLDQLVKSLPKLEFRVVE